ncbi:MAG: MATE family efflux transporter [Firmicutes bacterium]|nr:MATE family efflux transporter [Bacillota bacterium]
MDNQITKKNYLKYILAIALPVSIQSLFQSSLSVIDQIMVGSLGETSISAVGLGGKYPSVFFFTLASISVGAAILISQFRGKSDKINVSKAFTLCIKWGLMLTSIFFIVAFFFSTSIMSIYTFDSSVISIGSQYLKILTIGFFPGFLTIMLSTLLRNTGKAKQPMVASIVSVIINTLLNYILIFGHLGLPALGVAGAAIATTITRFIEFFVVLFFFIVHQAKDEYKINFKIRSEFAFMKTAFLIILPLFLSEFLWSVGENVYSIIYGHIGTSEMAAMTLITPVVMLSIGLFFGIYQSTSILVGNQLGKKDYDMAYFLGKKSMKIGLVGTTIIGLFVISFSKLYPQLFLVSDSTKQTTTLLLIAFAVVLWIKVSNMVLGGILKSGGKTKYVFYMDLLGTWFIGVPLGLIASSVFRFPIVLVYLIIAFEELVRLIIGLKLFKSKIWIQSI